MCYKARMARQFTSQPSALSRSLGNAFAEETLAAAARAEIEGIKPVGIAREPARKAAVRAAGVAEDKKPSVDFAAPSRKPRKRAKV